MTNMEAVSLAEGFEEGSLDEQIDAWQHLIDTGLAWQLQGWFGRIAGHLIDGGYCKMPGHDEQMPVLENTDDIGIAPIFLEE